MIFVSKLPAELKIIGENYGTAYVESELEQSSWSALTDSESWSNTIGVNPVGVMVQEKQKFKEYPTGFVFVAEIPNGDVPMTTLV